MKKVDENELNLMKHLINYGKNQEEGQSLTKPILEYHEMAKDGKTYGIIRECSRYYIKVAPKKDQGVEILPEEYDYLGGFNRRNDYSYRDYAEASKQFGLKMQSIAESVRGHEIITEANKKKEPQQAEWQVNETKEMRAELDRYKQLVRNVDGIIAEGSGFTADHTLPEAPAKNPSKEKVNGPYTKTAVAKGDKGFETKNASENKCKGAPFCDGITKSDQISDNKQPRGEKGDVYNQKAEYAPKDSVAYKKGKGKSVKYNEGVKRVFKLSEEQLNEYINERKAQMLNESGEYTDDAPVAVHNSDTKDMKKAGGTHIGTDGNIFNKKVHVNEEGDYTDGAPAATHNSDTENYGDGTSEVGDGDPFENEVGDAETSGSLNHGNDISEDDGFDMDDVAGMPDNDEDDDLPYPEVADDDEDEDDSPSIEISIDDDDNDEDDDAEDEYPQEAYRRYGRRMNEWEGHDFGNHPAYQKIPLTTPDGKAPMTWGHAWADGTEGSGKEPFGLRVGSGSPFDKLIEKLSDAVIDQMNSAKKKVK